MFGRVGIDGIAGPSEVVILADGDATTRDHVAMDLLAQAEHDEAGAIHSYYRLRSDFAGAVERRGGGGP